MLTIENLAWDHKEFTQLGELVKILATRLSVLKISTKINITDNKLLFNVVSGGKIALSTVDNKIMMSPGDPRIDKKKRNYLDTKRLNKDQYYGFYNTIQNTLDELNLKAKITFVEKGNHILREERNKFSPPSLKNFPLPK